MKKVGVLLVAVVLGPGMAAAQQPAADPQTNQLAVCLVQNSTDLERGLVRNFLIGALEQDAAPAGAYLRAILSQVGTLATAVCGAPADFGAQPWGAAVPTLYLNYMISRAIGDAITPILAPPADPAPAAPAPTPAAPPAVAPPAPFVPIGP